MKERSHASNMTAVVKCYRKRSRWSLVVTKNWLASFILAAICSTCANSVSGRLHA